MEKNMQFKDILLDNNFMLKGEMFRKVKAVFEDCCNPLYNAMRLSDLGKVYISNATPVQPCDPPPVVMPQEEAVEPEIVEDDVSVYLSKLEEKDIGKETDEFENW
jgi:hypothetical protein